MEEGGGRRKEESYMQQLLCMGALNMSALHVFLVSPATYLGSLHLNFFPSPNPSFRHTPTATPTRVSCRG